MQPKQDLRRRYHRTLPECLRRCTAHPFQAAEEVKEEGSEVLSLHRCMHSRGVDRDTRKNEGGGKRSFSWIPSTFEIRETLECDVDQDHRKDSPKRMNVQLGRCRPTLCPPTNWWRPHLLQRHVKWQDSDAGKDISGSRANQFAAQPRHSVSQHRVKT